jgi:hypothetical protein
VTTLTRRQVLAAAGAAAVLAACSSSAEEGAGETTTTLPSSPVDLRALQTAAALELLMVDIYKKAVDSGLVTDADLLANVKLFAANHAEHLELFESELIKLGSDPVTLPHQQLAAELEARVTAVKDQAALVKLLHDLELKAQATYQSFVGVFSEANLRLNQTVMSVAAVDARQTAVLALASGQPALRSWFTTTDGRLEAGSGL